MSSKCNLIVIDNFYINPESVRDFALKQTYYENHLPRKHTKSFATNDHKLFFENIILSFAGKITDFSHKYNGSFQYANAHKLGWCHYDQLDWAAIVYLTPDAQHDCGTSFYEFYDGTRCKNDLKNDEHENTLNTFKFDTTKWTEIDRVGNVFNRLVLYNAKLYHRPTNLFGNEIDDGRLTQVFFFNTEISN
jgi:Family of unknown function (DUF6445)